MAMHLPVDWSNGTKVLTLFRWQARVGIAPRFGSRPIGWYQSHQCAAHDLLVEMLGGPGEVRLRLVDAPSPAIIGRRDGEKAWVVLGTVRGLYDEADRRGRR